MLAIIKIFGLCLPGDTTPRYGNSVCPSRVRAQSWTGERSLFVFFAVIRWQNPMLSLSLNCIRPRRQVMHALALKHPFPTDRLQSWTRRLQLYDSTSMRF